MLRIKRANNISKKVLFVTICRTLGIPARINKEDQTVAYYWYNKWVNLGDSKENVERTGKIILNKENEKVNFDYSKNISISRLNEGVYTTLNLKDMEWKDSSLTIDVEPGQYRIITSNRQADESILARLYYVSVVEAGVAELTIGITEDKKQRLEIEVPDHKVSSLDGKDYLLSEVINQEGSIVAYLDVAAEPTEHLLNEIVDSRDKYNQIDSSIILIIKQANQINDVTLQKTLNAISHVKVYQGKQDASYLDNLYKSFKITDQQYPLVYTMSSDMKSQYAWSGYKVGIGEILLKYI